jgi:hypothetical protein
MPPRPSREPADSRLTGHPGPPPGRVPGFLPTARGLRSRARLDTAYVGFDVFNDMAGRVLLFSQHSIPVLARERGNRLPTTSKKDAKKAGKKLAAKSSTKKQKSAAASDLAQAARPGGSTSKKDAKKAGKKLAVKSSTKKQKSAAASALAQAKRPTGRTTKKKK